MTLSEFLLARIAEDEAVAGECQRLGADVGSLSTWVEIGSADADAAEALGDRFSPARVLAECEAKRRIVKDHTVIPVWPDGTGGAKYYTGHVWVCPSCKDDQPLPCRTLRLLAVPYADHPDYLEEWKP